jgi:hypothetical protein
VIVDEPVSRRLGCGLYELYVYDRANRKRLRNLGDWTSIEFAREIDEVSNLTATFGSASGDCCRNLAGLAPFAFSLGALRWTEDDVALDARNVNHRRWVGPVWDVQQPEGSSDVVVECRDLISWLQKRRLHDDLEFKQVDLATIFNTLVTHGMTLDNVPGLFPTAGATGILGDRSYKQTQSDYVYDLIQELARTGVDYTMVDSTMVAGSVSIATEPIGTLTDDHFVTSPGIRIAGDQMVNDWAVAGGGGGSNGHEKIGRYVDVDPEYGLLQGSVVESKITDQDSLNAAAASKWALTNQPVAIISSAALTQDAPLTFDQLVPGAVVTVKLFDTCFPVSGPYRLHRVEVAAKRSQDGLQETVKISLEPLGTSSVNE